MYVPRGRRGEEEDGEGGGMVGQDHTSYHLLGAVRRGEEDGKVERGEEGSDLCDCMKYLSRRQHEVNAGRKGLCSQPLDHQTSLFT